MCRITIIQKKGKGKKLNIYLKLFIVFGFFERAGNYSLADYGPTV